MSCTPTERHITYWGDLDASVEPNYSNDQYQDIAVPQKIGTGSLRARNAHLNEGWGVMSLVQELAGRPAAALDAADMQRLETEPRLFEEGVLALGLPETSGLMRRLRRS